MKITSEPPVLVWFRQEFRAAPTTRRSWRPLPPAVRSFLSSSWTRKPLSDGGRARLAAGGSITALHVSPRASASSPAGVRATSPWCCAVLAGRRAGDFALVLRSGPSERTLRDVIADTGQRRYSGTDVTSLMRSAALSGSWRRSAATASRFAASMPPCCSSRSTVQTAQGSPYRAFTPFYRASLTREVPTHTATSAHTRETARQRPLGGLAPASQARLGRRIARRLDTGRARCAGANYPLFLTPPLPLIRRNVTGPM